MEVGLDSFVVDRILVCFVQVFTILGLVSVFVLMPFYASEAPDSLDHPMFFKKYTIESLWHEQHSSLWLPVTMTWFNSLVVIFLLHREYKLYIKERHLFLRKMAPQSYTVLVEQVPARYCNETSLMSYFRVIFGDKVVSAHVVENNQNLNYAVKQRLKAVEYLEDSIFEFKTSGNRPWRLYIPWLCCGQIRHTMEPLGIPERPVVPRQQLSSSLVDSHDSDDEYLLNEEDAYLSQWHQSSVVPTQNDERKNCLWLLAHLNFCMYIDKIQSFENELEIWNKRVASLQAKQERHRKKLELEALKDFVDPSVRLQRSIERAHFRRGSHQASSDVTESPLSNGISTPLLDDEDDTYSEIMSSSDSDQAQGFRKLMKYGTNPFERSSAFVTFSSLMAAMCAAQSVIDKPLKMKISMAPELRDVLWNNIGLSMSVIAVSTWLIRILLLIMVLSFGGLTTFIAQYTSLDSLRKPDEWIDDFLKRHENWLSIFESISPIVLMIVYKVVPPIVNFILKLQRRKSLSDIQVEFFRIYYWFLIIQVFLFFIIGGSITTQLDDIMSNPKHVLATIAQSLQNFELFFLNFMVTRIGLLPLELLRGTDISLAVLRGFFKRSRTARARRNVCCAWHTIDNPSGGNPERTIANIALCFTIALSYSVICPIMCLFALCFAVLSMLVYRNQFLYVYTHERESGGILFPYLFRALMAGVFLFQLIMVATFSFHTKPSAALSCVPLLIITLSFMLFCENAYGSSSRFLPLGVASQLDTIMQTQNYEKVVYKHPSILAPANLQPESIEESPFHQVRRISFSVQGSSGNVLP